MRELQCQTDHPVLVAEGSRSSHADARQRNPVIQAGGKAEFQNSKFLALSTRVYQHHRDSLRTDYVR